MPEDMKIPFEYDGTGDVATVTGDEFFYRHAMQLALIASEDIEGGPLTDSETVEMQDTIGETLAGSPYISLPISVEIIDTTNETITIEVTASNIDTFEIEA